MFGYYITSAWDSEEVRNYVEQMRKKYQSESYYANFEALAKKLKERDNTNK